MALNDNGFTIKKMREVPKQKGLRRYYKLKKTELIEALGSNVNDEPVPLATHDRVYLCLHHYLHHYLHRHRC